MGKNRNSMKYPLHNQNSQFISANVLNDLSFSHYLRAFKKLVLSMFEWELPESMDSRWLEEVLFYNGMSALLFDKDLGFINTPCVNSGAFNLYGLATKYHCYSFNYHADRLLYTGFKDDLIPNDLRQCVVCFNCQDKEPTFGSIELFAYRMYMADRICDINLNNMKSPVLLLTDEKTKLSMQNMYAKYDGNEPVIVAKKGQFNPEDVTSIDTHAEFVADKIQEYKKVIWNELLTFLGINNLNEKKERLVSDEANQNNEVINLNLESFFIPRKEACKQFNELFNQNISVRLRSDLSNIIKRTESIVNDSNEERIDEMEEGEANVIR